MNKHRGYHRLAALVLCCALAGCGGGASNGLDTAAPPEQAAENNSSAAPAEEGRPAIKIVTDNFQPVDPDPDGAIMRYMEEVTGFDLDVTWYPTADYSTKINTLIAGGDLPEILMVDKIKSPYIVQAVRDGVFWDLTDELGKYPSLAAINAYQRTSISIDGRDWAIPRDMDMAFYAPVYRSDWLRNLGLEPPTTLEELYDMFHAFTYNDPDGNGKDDTYGMVESQGFNNFIQVLIFCGGPNEWMIENNEAVPMWEHEAYWQMLDFYRRAYDEGVLNQDFTTKSDQESKEEIEIGRAGGSIAHVWQISERWPNFKNNFPEGDLDVAYIVDSNGEQRHRPSNGGVSGMYLAPRPSVPDEAALEKVLTFLDRLADPRIQNMIQYGLEGIHYQVESDGTAKMLDQGAYDDEVNVFRRLKPHTMLEVMPPSMDDGAASRRDAFIKANADNTVANPVLQYVSDTYVEKGADLDQMMQDARVQYIMGALDRAGMEAVIARWYDQGGDKICAEYTALWQADHL